MKNSLVHQAVSHAKDFPGKNREGARKFQQAILELALEEPEINTIQTSTKERLDNLN